MGGSDENQKSSENYGNLEEMENAKPMDMSTVKMVSLPQLYIYIYIYHHAEAPSTGVEAKKRSVKPAKKHLCIYPKTNTTDHFLVCTS
jgi:chlorite dismutase